jgi:hypothetical protein
MTVVGNKVNEVQSAVQKVKVKTTTTTIVAENHPSRNGLTIVNTGSQNVWLGFGKAAVENEGALLTPGGSWNGMHGPLVWTGSVTGIAPAGETSVTVTEV